MDKFGSPQCHLVNENERKFLRRCFVDVDVIKNSFKISQEGLIFYYVVWNSLYEDFYHGLQRIMNKPFSNIFPVDYFSRFFFLSIWF